MARIYMSALMFPIKTKNPKQVRPSTKPISPGLAVSMTLSLRGHVLILCPPKLSCCRISCQRISPPRSDPTTCNRHRQCVEFVFVTYYPLIYATHPPDKQGISKRFLDYFHSFDADLGARTLGPDQTISGKVQSHITAATQQAKNIDEQKGYTKTASDVRVLLWKMCYVNLLSPGFSTTPRHSPLHLVTRFLHSGLLPPSKSSIYMKRRGVLLLPTRQPTLPPSREAGVESVEIQYSLFHCAVCVYVLYLLPCNTLHAFPRTSFVFVHTYISNNTSVKTYTIKSSGVGSLHLCLLRHNRSVNIVGQERFMCT